MTANNPHITKGFNEKKSSSAADELMNHVALPEAI